MGHLPKMNRTLYTSYNKMYADELRTISNLCRYEYVEFEFGFPPFCVETYDENTIKIIIDDVGSFYFKNKKLHKDDDEPAVDYENGTLQWYKYGKLHRDDDMPAIIDNEGGKEWWYGGRRHREDDKPAVIYYGGEEWWLYGARHREDDKPAIVSDSTQEWWVGGFMHRENNPAVIRNLAHDLEDYEEQENPMFVKEAWYFNGELHRLDGPAITLQNEIREWYIYGKYMEEHTFKKVSKNIMRFLHNMKKRYRTKVCNSVYNNTTICYDVCKMISAYVM